MNLPFVPALATFGCEDGAPFWPVARLGPWPCCWNTEEVWVLTVPLLRVVRRWLAAGILACRVTRMISAVFKKKEEKHWCPCVMDEAAR